MTEAEIMKALECCRSENSCEGCPYEFEGEFCEDNLKQDCIDLINRKNTEIERLTITMNAFGLGMKRESERADSARAEAIKEVFQAIDFMCIDTFGNFNHKAFINLKKRNGVWGMSVSKQTRQKVYEKYNGKCAYCGREIAYKDMQVDHFLPLRAWGIEDSGTDDISNLLPSCRMCNHYKRANSLETFRRYIAEIPKKLRTNYIYKVGVVYGNVVENEKPIIFYFEKVEKEGEQK